MQIAKQQKNCTKAKKMHISENERRNHTTTWHNCENKGATVKTKAQLQKIFLLFTLHCLLRLLDSAHSSAIPRSPPRYSTLAHNQQRSPSIMLFSLAFQATERLNN
jgi:hypothetical protein